MTGGNKRGRRGTNGTKLLHSRRHASEDIHRAVFPEGTPKAASDADMKAGIRRLMKRRHARG